MMRFLSSHRWGNSLILLSYFLLSAVPFFPVLFLGQKIESPLHVLGMEVLAWMLAWAIFKRPAWFHILLIPAFFALPVELYLRFRYAQSISPHHLGIITETSPGEIREFLADKIWLALALLIVIGIWWGIVWRAAWRNHDLDLSVRMRGVVFVAAMIATIFLFNPQYSQRYAPHIAPGVIAESAIPQWHIPFAGSLLFNFEGFGGSWPFGLAVLGYDFWIERKVLAALADQSRVFTFGAHQVGPATDEPQVVVLVIGESSRFDRWSLNGYQRQTTPLLEQESNLVSLTNMITGVSTTRGSVPVIISRKPVTQALNLGFSEKSLLSAYKEAGFKTYWLSNQMSFGKFDTPVSVLAEEADVVQFMNLGGFTDEAGFDQTLLTPFKKALGDSARKKLIVLHTLGSHWNYSHRYPATFDTWQPSLFGMHTPAMTDPGLKLQMNNSYDNSIRYTDWFLSQVVGTLKQSQQISALLYVADHGEILYDGSCQRVFHGYNTQFEFHIPAIVWYADQYQAAYPEKVAQLRNHKDAKLSTENVFHTLLDMADIRYASEQLDRSVVSSKLQLHTRYVYSYRWTDYDNAAVSGDCREVVARDDVSHLH